MARVDWLDLRKMNKEQIKVQWSNLAKEIEALSKYVGEINNESEHEKFLSDFSYCLDTLHCLRNRIDSFYFELD